MEFKKYKLNEIAQFSQGKQVDVKEQYEKKENGMKRFVRIVDYTNVNEPIRYVKDYGERYYASEKELVMIRYGSQTAGMVAMGKNGIIANNMFKINLDNSVVLNKYMYYYLSQKEIFNFLKNSQSSSTMPAISFSMLNNFEVSIPSIIIQRKVINVLEKIDDKIEVNNQINDNLSEIIERMFINFLEKHNEELVTLEDAVKKIGTGADAIQRAPIVEYDTGIRCIRVGDMTNSRNRYEWGFTEMTEKDFDNYKLDIGDIVVTRTAVNGLSYMIEDDMKVVCNNGLIRMKVNEKYNPMFIYLYLKTKDFNEYVHRIDGETSVRPNMKVNYFTSYKIMKISKEEQDEICNRLLPLRNKQKQIIEENNTLTQLRDTLLPKLMNGEIDLDKIEI